jgi:hypothetical protein
MKKRFSLNLFRKFDTKNLWTIALIADAMSPKTAKIYQQPFPPIERLVVYPLRAEDPDSLISESSCAHVLEKFMPTQKIKGYSATLKPEKNSELPIAAAVAKVRFDVQYHLHPINELIISTRGSDSCKQDVCAEFEKLRIVLKRQKRHISVLSVNPMGCPALKSPQLTLIDVSHDTPEKIVSKAKVLAAKNLKEANAVPAKVAAQEKLTEKLAEKKAIEAKKDLLPPRVGELAATSVTVSLNGPPLRLQLKPENSSLNTAALIVQSPATLHLAPGHWSVLVLSPSWLKPIAGLKLELKKNSKQSIDLIASLDSQVAWLKSDPDQDEMVALAVTIDGAPKQILIPQGGPDVPVPRNQDWKVFKVKK